ncbi:LamG-like jellyroll fold domain-containing protein [Lacipirellula parvula]|uniref:Ice-binding protein C-terminal domain-containing protein n=1 Tax=Lacipirellula parvula TaxID=2650471 RepID=A0A5K7XI57_9BACT|nr:LamG-like jellyroll fold domain-containing protein [Lacipirellula parvula]BBO35732.1 hypothetical protein PLANPX_5344 [Lacipirellula parvula]
MSFTTYRLNHSLSRRLLYAVVVAASAIAPLSASAAEVAYWRHEEGVAGQRVPDGPNTVLDASGNGNHMQTFSSAAAPFTAATYTTDVSPLALRSGAPNLLSLDFGPNPSQGTDDGGGQNDDNYTAGKPVQEQYFSTVTYELAFNMNAVGGYQALFGKDGKPLDSPVPPLKFLVRGDDFPGGVLNQLFVEWIDGNGVIHNLATHETVVAGEWNHVAFTLNATDAQLWVAGETGNYVLKDSITGGSFANGLGEVIVFGNTSYTIGRGMFDNNVTDWANAKIDEVRISDAVLTPDQFLFVPAPAADADFDGNGVVNGADFLIWQRGFGPSGTPTTGDANGNGTVDAADLAIWKAQFGGAPNVSAVPEPATLALGAMGIGVMALAARRRS